MDYSVLPHFHAVLNSIVSILLVLAYVVVKKGNTGLHKKLMSIALIVSGVFLASYLVYHYQVGSVPYPHQDWTRPIYFLILVPHIVLAGAVVPFIFISVYHAVKGNLVKHKWWVRFVWPVWLFVAVSGVVVYLMLYH